VPSAQADAVPSTLAFPALPRRAFRCRCRAARALTLLLFWSNTVAHRLSLIYECFESRFRQSSSEGCGKAILFRENCLAGLRIICRFVNYRAVRLILRKQNEELSPAGAERPHARRGSDSSVVVQCMQRVTNSLFRNIFRESHLRL
jgi:hypothetical protein